MYTFIIILVVILVLIYLGHKAFYESFDNSNDNKSLKMYVFVSDHCPHCHTYLDKHHNDVSEILKSKGLDIKRVNSDGSKESNDLFNKFDVQFVPVGIIVKGDKVYKNLGSNITPESVKYALEN
jgi:hypothetical protein